MSEGDRELESLSSNEGDGNMSEEEIHVESVIFNIGDRRVSLDKVESIYEGLRAWVQNDPYNILPTLPPTPSIEEIPSPLPPTKSSNLNITQPIKKTNITTINSLLNVSSNTLLSSHILYGKEIRKVYLARRKHRINRMEARLKCILNL